MAGDNLDLKIVIDTLLNDRGFEDAKGGFDELADRANQSAKGINNFGDSSKRAGEKLGGTRGPVGDLTRAILVSIGATRGAGEAARVAGLGMQAFEGATKAAHLALAGISLGIVLLLPKLIEWIGSTKKLAEENDKLAKSIGDQDEQLRTLIENAPTISKVFKEWAAAVHEVAMTQQAMKMDELVEQMNALIKEGEKGLGMWDRLVQFLKDDTLGVHEDTEATKRLRQHKSDLVATFLALSKQMSVLVEAQRRGVTVQQLEEIETKKAAQAKSGLRISQEAYTKAIKQWEFAERSAAVARDKQKKQEAEEIDRQNKLIRLYKQEADAKRDAARAATEAAADRIEAENETEQRSLDIKKQALAMGLSAASDAFKKNKALAIAAAIADTYAGATAALGMKPWTPANFAMMAAVIAQGLANVANIRKSEVGFDDPMSDMLATKLGRKSAADFVQYFGSGFREGFKGMGGGSSIQQTTINRGMTMNVTANGVLGSRTAFRSWLEREMTLADRVRARKTI